MVDYKTRGTLSPATDFNVENVVSRLRKAMRGIGTDEKVIIDILTGHSNSQRQIIKKKYKTIYGRVLEEDIKSELGGHFEDVCLALLTPLAEYIVDCFYFAIKGLRTDEKCIIELLISLESMDLRYVKTVFQESPIHGGSWVESGFEPATLRSRGRDLTTKATAARQSIGFVIGGSWVRDPIPPKSRLECFTGVC
ncbi:Annexin-B12 [Araneus ventricosus]|uniref:Annexin-B12 n=1 Tax=Araneus ventricosus TaxID=182803 RepID=A0A4Y2LHE0_ARAVE|nr:Annexin-B12 [Araneus ventricosus]